MDKDKALRILKESLIDLDEKQKGLTIADLENEVINLSCVEIIKKRKNNSTDIENMFLAFNNSQLDIIPISKAFTESAMELFPDEYNVSKAIFAVEAVKTNVFLDNAWELFREYFMEKHHRDINDELNSDNKFLSNTMVHLPLSTDKAEIFAINDKIRVCTEINQLRKQYNIYGNYYHPQVGYDFGVKFLIFGDKINAVKAFIKAAHYGIKYPCQVYDTLFVDAVGQSFMYLLTKFTMKSIENTTKATELSYLYLSRCIELMPKQAYDSYRSRALLFSIHKNPVVIESIILNNLGFGVSIEPFKISDFYFAANTINSPHKEALADAKWLHRQLDDLSIGGKDADEYTLDEMANYGKNRHFELFKIIEKKYLQHQCNLNFEDIQEFEYNV